MQSADDITERQCPGEMIDYSGRLIKVEDIIAPRAIAPLFLLVQTIATR